MSASVRSELAKARIELGVALSSVKRVGERFAAAGNESLAFTVVYQAVIVEAVLGLLEAIAVDLERAEKKETA